MSEMPSKTHVPVSVPSKTRKFYTQDHITTHTFMSPRPIFSREYIPGRNMSVKVDSFIRCNPMPVPIFGHCKVHNRAFFVPFRAVMHDFNEFYTNTSFNYAPSSGPNVAIPTSVYYMQNRDLVNFFYGTLDQTNGLLVTGSSTDFDIVIYEPSSNPIVTVYAKFTILGIRYFSILESLGYKINWQLDDHSYLSAMPLMCYAKIMMDWYYPSAYVGDSVYNSANRLFQLPRYDKRLDSTDITTLMSVCNYITYNPDYFVNAWDYPTGPNNVSLGTSERDITITDVTNDATLTIQGVSNSNGSLAGPSNANAKPTNGTPYIGNTTANSTYIAGGVTTQYVLDALKSLTDYTKRHQLAGVRALDRYLAELGINLSAEIMNRSMYLGSKDFDMEFYDVFSHADTESQNGSPLGAYAGKGNGYGGNMTFDYENGQEFGMFIIVNSIIPVVGYYQGSHRETLHVQAMDFYHGDFDHMAVQPISCREVYVTQDGSHTISGYAVDNGNGLNSQIFGYAPKYIEYNTPMDLQTGLYRIKTRSKLLPCYSLMRDLSYYESGLLPAMKHNIGFVRGNDSSQYNRIFYLSKGNKDGIEDQFNAIHHFEVSQTDSTLPAYDTYEFKHEGDEYEGKKVTLDINGSKLN